MREQRKVFRIPLAVALVSSLLTVSLVSGAPLQRSRSGSGALVLPNNVIGLQQPESVRSILLMYLARTLTKSRAIDIERDLQKSPENIDNRLTLIGYYSWNGQTAADRLRLRTHVLWMIENHPEHAATAEPTLRDLPDDMEGNQMILEAWQRNLQSHPDDPAVARNAEKFFFGRDPQQAETIIRRLAEWEPGNRQWPLELARLYTTFGVPGFPPDEPDREAFEAFQRVLEVTRDRTSREKLAGDMAESAFRTVHFSAAVQFAKIDLQTADPSAIQRANTLLGRVALRSGDLAGARQYLLDSAKPEASPQVSTFGPTMVLAKELLEKGERDIVLRYLESCLVIWPRGENVLQVWIEDLKNGRTPDFGTFGN